jgi:predicted transcriptional regulator
MFDAPARARRADPPTSHEAARSVKVTDLEAVVLEALRLSYNGLTSHELAERTGLSLVTVSPRLRPLADKGEVRDSGRKRKGESGRNSIVWEAA